MQRRSFATLALILAPMFATSAVAIADGPATPAATPAANAEAIARGAYLVRFGSCNDCHTPWTMGPRGPAPDMTRALSGHPGDVPVPPPPANTGRGSWPGSPPTPRSPAHGASALPPT